MPTYVGSPSHKNRTGYALARIFIILVIVAATTGWLWVVGTSFGLFGSKPVYMHLFRVTAAVVPFLLAMCFALVALSARKRNSRLETVVDGELGKLSELHMIFCGRPWTGETAPRSTSRPDASFGGWGEITDLQGRPLGSIKPHRVVLAPSGIWLVMVESGIPQHDLASRRASARESGLALTRFLKNMTMYEEATDDTYKVHTLLADPRSASLYDVTDGGARTLGDLATLISAAPPRLPGVALRALIVALASNYPDGDRGVAHKELDLFTAA